MLYGILCWLLPCLTLAARVFYRAAVTSDCRFVFDLHCDYLLTTLMFLIFLREYLNCFLFQVFVPDPSRNTVYLQKHQEDPKDSGLFAAVFTNIST